MEKHTCKDCQHFLQHYILDDQNCSAINCGHCVFPQIKHRKPYTTACKHLVLKDHPPSLPNRMEVIRFLTTDILQEIMNLPLPPEIAELAENRHTKQQK